MKVLEATKKEVNLKEFVKRNALEEDCNQLIDYDCLVTVDGQPEILYFALDDLDTRKIRTGSKADQLPKE